MSNKTFKAAQAAEGRKYGLFSLLALIVGVVIGSGIFVKNGSVYESTGSAVMSLVTWGIVSFIIMLMVFAFIEIASSNKKTGKPGTISGWVSSFISPKIGKYIGIYVMFVYFPSIIAAFPQWGADTIMSEAAPGLTNQWAKYGSTMGISLVILGVIMFLNIRSQKGSKIFGTSGMVIKIIPLVFVIVAAIVFVSLGKNGHNNPIGAPEFPPNEVKDYSMFKGVLLAMPAILFAFDGFIFSASMQNEAKNEKTFMFAWVGGMLFVIGIYIAYSLSIFVSADWVNLGLKGSIENVLGADTARWLSPLMQSFVIISITSGLNGNFINASKTMSSLSEEDIIPDKNGSLLKYNDQANPQYSTYLFMAVTLGWFFMLRAVDATALGINQSVGFMAATNFITDFGAVSNFFLYSTVMIGGIVNRKTNKVEVDKKWYFVPTAAIAAAGITFIAGFQVYNIFSGLFTDAAGSWYQFVVFVLMIGGVFGAKFVMDRQQEKVTPEDTIVKEAAKAAYLKQEVAEEFLSGPKPFKYR